MSTIMAQFQLPHSKLFPTGTRLFVSGNSGIQRLVLQIGKQVTLELAGLATSAKPTIRQVPLQSMMDVVRLVTFSSNAPDVVSISALTGNGTKRSFTVKAVRPGVAVLMADGAGPLFVVAGMFTNHTGFDQDLIADVFRDCDPAKMHILTRMLFSNSDNLFNEKSTENIKRWGSLACGTVAKHGSTVIFHPVDYDTHPYYKPLPRMGTAAAGVSLKRTDLKYDEARLKRGCLEIQRRLAKGLPSIVGLVWKFVFDPSGKSVVQPDGTLDQSRPGGHWVSIVGGSADANIFLYIDVWPNGSKLKYLGGYAGKDLFQEVCHYLGVFEWTNDAARGCPVLRARPDTGEAFSNPDEYLEVIAGPLG